MYARRTGPFPQRVRDVGVVHDLAPHDIDVMRFLLDSAVERVYAETRAAIATEHEDMLWGVLRFRNGVVGVLDVNWLTPTKVRQLSLLGEKGLLQADYLSQQLSFYPKGRDGQSPVDAPRAHPRREAESPCAWSSRPSSTPFAAASRRPSTAEDGLAALEIASLLVESARSGPRRRPSTGERR